MKAFVKKLQPFAELYREIEAKIEAATDQDLKALFNASKRATQTNCWWATYRAARIVQTAANSEIQRRKLAKRKS